MLQSDAQVRSFAVSTNRDPCYIRPEQGIERQIDPLSDEAVVPRPSLCGAVADDYGSAVPWTKRSGGDRAAGWTVAGGRSWRSARRGEPDPGSHRSTRGESSTRLDLELLVVFDAVARRSERPRARRPDGTGRSLRSVTRLGGLTRPFLIQWMRRRTSRLRASEPEAQADRRIDVDRPSGLKAVGEAVLDFRPHHTGIHVEFLGETEAIIDER